jgi:hypothetical protein
MSVDNTGGETMTREEAIIVHDQTAAELESAAMDLQAFSSKVVLLTMRMRLQRAALLYAHACAQLAKVGL